jgi:hypothetical protein
MAPKSSYDVEKGEIILFAKHIKYDETKMGRTCSTHGGKRNVYRVLDRRAIKKETTGKTYR